MHDHVYPSILTYLPTHTHTHTNASWCLCKQLHFGSLIKILLKLQLQHQHKLQIYACSLRSALASSATGPASSPIPSPAWSHAMQMAARQTCCCLSLSLSVSLNFLRNICGVRKPPPQKINQSIDSARFRKCYKSGTLKYSAYQVDTHRKLLLYQFICYSGQTPGIYIFNFQNWQLSRWFLNVIKIHEIIVL